MTRRLPGGSGGKRKSPVERSRRPQMPRNNGLRRFPVLNDQIGYG